MAGGNPYADPSSGSRYLPGYQRQVVGASGATAPNTSGFDFAAKWSDNFWKDVEKFTGAATNLAATYYDIREKRDIRDTETLINETLRQRKLDIFSSKTGKAADNLLEEESAWQLEAREEVIKKSGLGANIAASLWDKKAQDYLTRVGAFMLEQNRVAESNSRFAAMVDAQADLTMSPVGDFKAYALYSAKMDNLYGPLTKEGIQAKEKGIDVLIDSWTEQNPQATLNWFNQNKDGLREVLGREFPGIANAMERVRNRLESQMRRAELQAQRNDRLSAKRKKEMDRQFQSDSIIKILGDEDVDIREIYKEGVRQGISGQTLLDLQKIFEGRENISLKDSSGTLRSTYYGKATTEGLTSEERETLDKALANRQILPSDYQATINADERTKKSEENGIKEIRKGAMRHLKTAIAPRGAFDTVNQAAENLYEKLAAEIDKYVDNLSTVEEKRKALDITSPNSYVMQVISLNAGGRSSIDRSRDAYSTQPFDPNRAIKLPKSMERLPGETPKQWRERTGK